jgi:translation initiation factor IF-2
MAENTPHVPPGTVPPKPSESAKVQPKKETVRINLPPKPTAAPTIKIPSPAAVAAATPAPAAPVAGAAGSATAVPAGSAPSTQGGARAAVAAPAAAPRPAMSRPMPSAPALSVVDKALAIAAAVVGLLAFVRIFMLAS